MKVLAYLLIPAMVVAAAATISWVRNRQPTSLQSGVDSFRREMDALSPDAAPQYGRREEPGASGPRSGTTPPRRPPTNQRER